MKFSLPVFDFENNVIDRVECDLDEKEIQTLLDAVCMELETDQPDIIRDTALELDLVDPGRLKNRDRDAAKDDEAEQNRKAN